MPNTQTTVLITGCSKGFGLLFAKQLASAGHKVFAGARDLKDAEELLSAAQTNNNLNAIELDVNNPAHIEAALHKIKNESGKLTVLINNAGYGLMGKVEELEHHKLVKQFETNVFAPVNLIKAFLPLLNANTNGGLVINLSSIASYLGLPSFGAYSASKMALNGLSMSLATENTKAKLSVVVIEPGPFQTQFRESAEKASGMSIYGNGRSKLFPTQQDPSEVVDLVSQLIEQKANDELGSFAEIPVGKNSNFLRLVSRWLPLEWIVKGMASQVNK